MVILYLKCLTDTLNASCSRAGAVIDQPVLPVRGSSPWRNGPAGVLWCSAKGSPVACLWGTTPGTSTGQDLLENSSQEKDPGAVAGGRLTRSQQVMAKQAGSTLGCVREGSSGRLREVVAVPALCSARF